MTYRSSLAFLDSLVNYERQARPRTRFKLDSIRRLLELAGNPQQRMRNVILVAGTKGKGSVCYMLDAALRGCGLSTGMFISPHVLDIRERIQLDGKPIPERLFARLVSRLAPFVAPSSSAPQTAVCNLQTRVPVSYFEMTTAMAFLLFADKQPDYSVVEVGLGGRLDAANLSDPRVSVITRIGYDHLKVLGNTLTKIAGEKAGIMRRGRPVVIGEQGSEALAALRDRATGTGAKLRLASSVASVRSVRPVQNGVEFSARARFGAGMIRLPLLGRHQVENCRTALAVLGELAKDDARIKFIAVARGLKTVLIPARCQVVRDSSLLPPLSSLVYIVDSCHNPESGRALANVLRDHLSLLRTANRQSPFAIRHSPKVILVYGSLSGKLVAKTVAPLAPFVQQAILVQPDNPRGMPLAELKRIFSRLHIPFVTAESVPAGLARARRLAQAQVPAQARSGNLQPATCKLQTILPIIVAGSFYLAGEALKLLGPSRASRACRRP
jgi:dihydrofolate synthase/folylpolyglutamate synthase